MRATTHYLLASKLLTAAWGGVAISFALFANLVENLIQAINILGSIFYGSILGIFLVAFFLRFVRGSAVFAAALTSQALVLILFYTTKIGYLWYNLIGCVVVSCALFQPLFEKTLFRAPERARLTTWQLPSSVSANSPAGFFRAVFFSPKSRQPGGCNAKSAVRSFSFITTATTIRVKRSQSCAIDRVAGSIDSTSSLRTNCRSSSRLFLPNASCPNGRRKPRGNFRTLFHCAWSKLLRKSLRTTWPISASKCIGISDCSKD